MTSRSTAGDTMLMRCNVGVHIRRLPSKPLQRATSCFRSLPGASRGRDLLSSLGTLGLPNLSATSTDQRVTSTHAVATSPTVPQGTLARRCLFSQQSSRSSPSRPTPRRAALTIHVYARTSTCARVFSAWAITVFERSRRHQPGWQELGSQQVLIAQQ